MTASRYFFDLWTFPAKKEEKEIKINYNEQIKKTKKEKLFAKIYLKYIIYWIFCFNFIHHQIISWIRRFQRKPKWPGYAKLTMEFLNKF